MKILVIGGSYFYGRVFVMEYAKEMGEGLGIEKARKSGIEEW